MCVRVSVPVHVHVFVFKQKCRDAREIPLCGMHGK